ncbi:hypothetical protein THMIRHAT_07710 [Thiosulfativibrio zosterae]|uniref:Cell shape-determining protein MreC n=2 Tax=Thiosulfativibrio zosterae TaxID=2675053 RepID=A0A6F8PLR4_9GAMM|nr:hypothetical protein THMIRHAT_07710 [Thiosulfativibrio zosterae]
MFSIVLMVTDHYTQLMDNVRSVLLTALDPIEKVATAPQDIYKWLSQDFNTLSQLENDKQQLETENLLLKAQLQQLNKYKIEVTRLNALLGTASQIPKNTSQIASVIGYSDSPLAHFLVVNRGQLEKVKLNSPVIDAQGLIGKVNQLSLNSGRVLLITDPDSQVPVRIQRTGQRGILTGTGNDKLLLEYIPNSSSIIIGDIVETSGLGGIFPEGIPVAKVASLQNWDDQPYFEIYAQALANLHISNKVLILQQPVPTSGEVFHD